MTRREENQMVIDEMIRLAEGMPTGTYEEMTTFHLASISNALWDISKSLAIIAGKFESDAKEMTKEQAKEFLNTVYGLRKEDIDG